MFREILCNSYSTLWGLTCVTAAFPKQKIFFPFGESDRDTGYLGTYSVVSNYAIGVSHSELALIST